MAGATYRVATVVGTCRGSGRTVAAAALAVAWADAAWVRARGPVVAVPERVPVAGVEHVDTIKEGHRTYFIFKPPDGGIRDLKNQYFNRTAKVSALGFADEVRGLKALMHMADEE